MPKSQTIPHNLKKIFQMKTSNLK